MHEEKMNAVYHYCSLDIFLKIIQNKSIRLSDIGKSNDYTERIYMENKIHDELVKKIQKEFSTEIVNNILKIEELCRCTINETRVLYAMCFSEEKDLLSQWRGYAEDGMGVSIGFSKNILDRTNEQEYGLSFKKICYSEEEQEEFVKKQVNTIFDTMQRKNIYASFAEVYENQLESIGCMKNSGFAEEREWRLCKAMMPEMMIDHGAKFMDFKLSKVYDQCIRNQIITYFNLSFENVFNDLITEIIIGPKAKVTERDIYRSLYINGFRSDEIKVTRAKVTYR